MATDFHLKVDGIEGESLDEKHKGEIEIDSFTWGVTQEGSTGRGGGGGTGKANYSDIKFVKRADKASPKLVKAASSGEHIKSAVLTCRKASGKGGQVEYLKITLEDVMVNSFQSSGAAGGGSSVPSESFSFNFAKIKYEYMPQKADGTLEGAISASYDRALNKAA